MSDVSTFEISTTIATAIALVAMRRSKPVGSETLAIVVAIVSAGVGLAIGKQLVAFESAVLVVACGLGILKVVHTGRSTSIGERTSASSALVVATVASAWLETLPLSIALLLIATSGKGSSLRAGVMLIPLLLLSSDRITESVELAAAVVLLCGVQFLGRPTGAIGRPLVVSMFLVIVLGQLGSSASAGIATWRLSTALAPAFVLQLLLAGGRSLNAVSLWDILESVACCIGVQASAGYLLVIVRPELASSVGVAVGSSLLLLIASIALVWRTDHDGELPLDVLAGQGSRNPLRIGLLSLALMSILPVVPLVTGWAWLEVAARALGATRTEPQPTLLLIGFCMAGPLVIVPSLVALLRSVWRAVPKATTDSSQPAAHLAGGCLVAVSIALALMPIWYRPWVE